MAATCDSRTIGGTGMSTRVCQACKTTYDSTEHKFCPHCGARYVDPTVRSCLIAFAVVMGIVVLLFGCCFLLMSGSLFNHR